MTLFLISWFVFSYSFPATFNIGMRHDIASNAAGVERIVNGSGVYMVKVSLIKDGRRKEIKLIQRVGE